MLKLFIIARKCFTAERRGPKGLLFFILILILVNLGLKLRSSVPTEDLFLNFIGYDYSYYSFFLVDAFLNFIIFLISALILLKFSGHL